MAENHRWIPRPNWLINKYLKTDASGAVAAEPVGAGSLARPLRLDSCGWGNDNGTMPNLTKMRIAPLHLVTSLTRQATLPSRWSLWIVLALVVLLPGAAPGDVIVIANQARETVEFRVAPVGGQPVRHEVPVGELVAVPSRGSLELLYDMAGNLIRYHLDANAAYYFTNDKDGWLQIRKIDLGGNEDTYAGRALPEGGEGAPAIGEIPIKILVDDNEPTTRRIWEPRLRRRLAQVSDILEQHCRLRLKVVAVEQWDSDDSIEDVRQGLLEFEREVDAGPAWLAIGFTGKYRSEPGRVHLGGAQGLLRPHILIREWSPTMTEPERLEVLLHEVGHYLGSVHSPDPNSVMRPLLADNKAVLSQFRIGFDPVNTLIMNMVGEEIRHHRARSINMMSNATRTRLNQIYGALAKAVPNDKTARQFQFQLGLVASSPLARATREVVQRVALVAKEREAEGISPRKQDTLTEHYVSSAARTALALPPEVAPAALLLGLGIALDHSRTLLSNSLTREFCRTVENETERQDRIRNLGQPTIRQRRDLAQHFFLSAYLTVVVGPQAAEAAGVAKELVDARSGSGFSYADLAADLAGIVFADKLLRGEITIEQLAGQFQVQQHMPEVADLPEGIGWDEARKQLVGQGESSLAGRRRAIIQRIKQL
jgi:hypothetical protein